MKRALSTFTLIIAAWLCACAIVDVSEQEMNRTLKQLDNVLEHRKHYIDNRQRRIDILVDSLNKFGEDEALLLKIAEQYKGFNNDSALHYLSVGLESARCSNKLPFSLARASLLPLSGFFSPALEIYQSINPEELNKRELQFYYDSGRQMYSYMAAFTAGDPALHKAYNNQALQCQLKLLDVLPKESIDHSFNLGEYYFLSGHKGQSRALLEQVMESTDDNLIIARAAHHLSTLAHEHGNENAYIYYLAKSAIADASAATREVASLQELGSVLYTRGDVSRAYRYLTEALANAVECGAPLRMIESSRSLPLIEHANTERVNNSRRIVYVILCVLFVVLIVLIITIAILRREMRRMTELQDNLRHANKVKEVYISQFLKLCSIYMDKLNQFCDITTRKIAAGQVDDLYRLTKSGKFVEEQSKEFYEVFDNAFLHLYPDFVKEVNSLLRPDAQIVLKDGELLNTDLRILAFMRLGIEESSRIAQTLKYSLNTIYAYRNRTKARAINRDTFESDVMKISSNV